MKRRKRLQLLQGIAWMGCGVATWQDHTSGVIATALFALYLLIDEKI